MPNQDLSKNWMMAPLSQGLNRGRDFGGNNVAPKMFRAPVVQAPQPGRSYGRQSYSPPATAYPAVQPPQGHNYGAAPAAQPVGPAYPGRGYGVDQTTPNVRRLVSVTQAMNQRYRNPLTDPTWTNQTAQMPWWMSMLMLGRR